MKHIIGGLVGALVTGVAILGWNGRAPEEDFVTVRGMAQPRVQLASDRWTPADAMQAETFASEPIVNVSCEPGQRAVLRRGAPGQLSGALEAACVDNATHGGWQSVQHPVMPAAPAAGYATPAVYRAPRAVPAQAAYREYREPVSRRTDARRSWKKTALVIGGSAGAGAGIGALAGGKKGALIGAAVGGGAGSVYELLKRK